MTGIQQKTLKVLLAGEIHFLLSLSHTQIHTQIRLVKIIMILKNNFEVRV